MIASLKGANEIEGIGRVQALKRKSYTDLHRRLSRALEVGRGIRLEAADLDLFAESGAYDVFCKAVSDELRNLAMQRREERNKNGKI